VITRVKLKNVKSTLRDIVVYFKLG